MAQLTFNDIQIGKKFQTYSKITYLKESTTEAKPVLDAKGKTIANGRVSTSFYNTKIPVMAIE